MEHSRSSQQPFQGASPSPTGPPLTPQEQMPIIILHVDIDNAATVSTRYASHILAEATWGTVNSGSGEWLPTDGSQDVVEEGLSFGDYLRLRYKNSAKRTADVEELEQRLQAFGNCAKVKRKTRKVGSGQTSVDQVEAAVGALRERHRSLLRRFMLPPTVCMALGCEAPDLNTVLGCQAEAKPDSRSSDCMSLEADHGEEGETPLNSPSSLPLQLHHGYWNIAPSFLSLLFSLVRTRRVFRLVFHTRRPLSNPDLQAFIREFNFLCEGKHPAFDGENRTKQVFLDGTHGSPDLRISQTGIGIMHIHRVQVAGEGRCWQQCSTSHLPHKLVIPAANRCYNGADEVFAGLVYQELEEHKAFCIIHKPLGFLCCGAESQRAGELNSSSTAEEYLGGVGTRNEYATTGEALEANDSLSCTAPLTVLADGQDLTRFHVCLSAPGIQTVVDGISHLHTLVPVDVLGQQPLTLKPIPWLENWGVEGCSQQTLPSDDNVRKKGRIECAAVASHISPSQWDFLASSDCLVAALAICEKKRLQLATANHLCTIEQVARDKITALHGEHRELAGEQKKQDGISERGKTVLGLIGTLGSHLSTSKQTLQHLPDIAYLMETVVPVLYPALESVLRYRPDDPLAYLAFYLLRHANGYSRTATTL